MAASKNRCKAALVIKDTKRPIPGRKGIGLYSYWQAKNTTPFQYFAQVVVGTIIAALGWLVLNREMAVRGEEIQKYGYADTHFWGWFIGLAVLLNGVIVAHAGIIFWTQRMVMKVGAAYNSHKLRR